MKIQFRKSDFSENFGKLFSNYLRNISQWETNIQNKSLFGSDGVRSSHLISRYDGEFWVIFNSTLEEARTVRLLVEKIAEKNILDKLLEGPFE